MPKRINSKGFSTIGIIAIVLVIAAIGLAGWYVWNKNHKDNTTKVQDKTSQKSEDGKKNSEKPSDPSENGKYLVIKEWGVRFLLPETLKGDIYYQVSANDLLKAEFTNFASNKLDNLTGDDTCTFKSNPQNVGLSAYLSRSSQNILEESQSPKQRLIPIKKIGGVSYYYTESLISPPITCLTNSHEEFNDVERSISDQLNQAFSRLEPVKE